MSWAHLHLALNHVPVIGIVLAILLLGAAVVRRNQELTRVSYWLVLSLAIVTLAVYLTGEPAEELVEDLAGVSEPLIESHEEAALIATVGMSLLGLVAAVGLRRRQSDAHRSAWFPMMMLILSVSVGALMAWTANLGGQIRHSEIRSAAAAVVQGSVEAAEEAKGEAEDD
jgi:uncharacterized membrane protein